MMQFTIYTYGNIEDIYQVLLSIAHIAKDSAFLSITGSFVLLAVAIGYIYFHVNSVMGKPADPLEPAKKLFMLLALVSVLVLTKGNAILYDPTLNQTKRVPEVPIGILVPASFFSKIQEAIIDLLEDNAPPIPKEAVMMGRSFDMLVALNRLPETYSKLHPCIMINVKNYIKECYLPNALRDNSLQNLLKPSNKSLFERIKVKDDSITLNYYTENSTTKECVASSDSYTCSGFYNKLNTDIKNTIPASTSMLAQKEIFLKVCRAAVKNPEVNTIQCSGLLENLEDFINKAGTDGTVSVGLSKYAESQILMDYMRDIYYNLISGSSTAKALYTARNSMISSQFASGVMASKYVKKLRSVMYAIVLALFPIIILLMALTGLAAFRWYFGMFVWLGLWGVVEAIMDLLARNHLYSILADIRDKGLSLDFMLEFPTKSVEMSSFYGNAEWLAGSVALAMTMGILKVGNYAVAQIAGQIGSNIQGAASREGGKLGTHAGQTAVDKEFSENISTQAYKEIYNSADNARYLGLARTYQLQNSLGSGKSVQNAISAFGEKWFEEGAQTTGALGTRYTHVNDDGTMDTTTMGPDKGILTFGIKARTNAEGASLNIGKLAQTGTSRLYKNAATMARKIDITKGNRVSTLLGLSDKILAKVGAGHTVNDLFSYAKQVGADKQITSTIGLANSIQKATNVDNATAMKMAYAMTFLKTHGVDVGRLLGKGGFGAIMKALKFFKGKDSKVAQQLYSSIANTRGGKLLEAFGANVNGDTEHQKKIDEISKWADQFSKNDNYSEILTKGFGFTSALQATQSHQTAEDFMNSVTNGLNIDKNFAENLTKTASAFQSAEKASSVVRSLSMSENRDLIKNLIPKLVQEGYSGDQIYKKATALTKGFYNGDPNALKEILMLNGIDEKAAEKFINETPTSQDTTNIEDKADNIVNKSQQITKTVDEKTDRGNATQDIFGSYAEKQKYINKEKRNLINAKKQADKNEDNAVNLYHNTYKKADNDMEKQKQEMQNKGLKIKQDAEQQTSNATQSMSDLNKSMLLGLGAWTALKPLEQRLLHNNYVDMSQLPENERKQPENERKLPENERKQPENEKKQPENEKKQPENERKQPENEKKQPENERKQPENEKKGGKGRGKSWLKNMFKKGTKVVSGVAGTVTKWGVFRGTLLGVLVPENLAPSELDESHFKPQNNKDNNNENKPPVYKIPGITATANNKNENPNITDSITNTVKTLVQTPNADNLNKNLNESFNPNVNLLNEYGKFFDLTTYPSYLENDIRYGNADKNTKNVQNVSNKTLNTSLKDFDKESKEIESSVESLDQAFNQQSKKPEEKENTSLKTDTEINQLNTIDESDLQERGYYMLGKYMLDLGEYPNANTEIKPNEKYLQITDEALTLDGYIFDLDLGKYDLNRYMHNNNQNTTNQQKLQKSETAQPNNQNNQNIRQGKTENIDIIKEMF